MKALRRYPDVPAMLRAMKPSYPVYCVRRAAFRRAARAFIDDFPGLVLYAVKCNPHPLVLRALYEAGIRHFDTASLPEVGLVWELFDEAEAYFHNPVKSRAAIDMARRVYEVWSYTIDSHEELDKLSATLGPGGGSGEPVVIMVRFATPGGFAAYDLSAKFGATPAVAADLLRAVAERGFQAGLAFHVGSQCIHPEAWSIAMRQSGDILERAGVPIRCLNVGGGFPADYPHVAAPALPAFIEAIRRGREEIGLDPSVTLMCEPGRALVADGVSLVVQVHLRKGNMLYINDGIYGSLSETVTAGLQPPLKLHRPDGAAPQQALAAFKMFGPTCDNTDVLPNPFYLPADVREGDWIEIGQLGAYSNALATRFNGFFPETFLEIEDPKLPAEPPPGLAPPGDGA